MLKRLLTRMRSSNSRESLVARIPLVCTALSLLLTRKNAQTLGTHDLEVEGDTPHPIYRFLKLGLTDVTTPLLRMKSGYRAH